MIIKYKTFREIFAGAPVVIPEYVLEHAYEKLVVVLEKEGNQTPAQEVLAFYVSEYEARYKKRPIWEGKDIKRLKEITQLQGAERMKKLLLVYLELKDPKFSDVGYDLFTFLNSINRIARIADAPPPPLQLPTTNKPRVEYEKVKEIVIAVPPPPDLIKSLKKSMAEMNRTIPSQGPSPEEQREKLRRQAEELRRQSKKKGEP